MRKSEQAVRCFRELAEFSDLRHASVHLPEAVSRADKRYPRQVGGIQVALGVADVHRPVDGITAYYQLYVFALAQPGGAGALKIVEQPAHSRNVKKILDIPVLAVADDDQRVFFPCSRIRRRFGSCPTGCRQGRI